MDKKTAKTISIALAAIIIVTLVATYIYNSQEFRYRFERNNVLILSDTDNVPAMLDSYRGKSDFLLVTDFQGGNPETNYVFNSMLTLSVVLTGHDKNAITLLRVIDANGSLLNCSTNLGDYNSEVELSAGECTSFVENSNALKIFIKMPDSSLQEPQIKLKGNEVFILPNSYSTANIACYTLAEMFYSDASDIINKSNILIGKLGG